MLTLESFDATMRDRDISLAYMDDGFRTAVREAILARDRLQTDLDRLTAEIEQQKERHAELVAYATALEKNQKKNHHPTQEKPSALENP